MPIYRYVKYRSKLNDKTLRVLPLIFIFIGMLTLTWVIWPIVSFQFVANQFFTDVISPVQESDLSRLKMREVVQAASDNFQNQPNDFIDPNTWYPTKPQNKISTPIDRYTLSIPKLNIKNAKVIIAGDSLDESLIHYGGTGLPGENGTTVIFGHSTLPQLFDPKNYKTIFSFLPTLKPASESYSGDEIYINYENMIYRYVVYDMKVLKPSDLSVLDQLHDGSFLTLVTCVPPGTFWERLNVRAKLVSIK